MKEAVKYYLAEAILFTTVGLFFIIGIADISMIALGLVLILIAILKVLVAALLWAICK